MVQRMGLLLLMWGANAPGWAQDDGPQRTDSPADTAVYRRIEQLRRVTARLRADGQDRDWRAVGQMADPRGDAGGDDGRDIVAAAIAPTADDLWIMIRTAGAPANDRWAFYVDLDVWGSYRDDLRIETGSPPRGPTVRFGNRQGRFGEPAALGGVTAIVRHVVEIRVPYHSLTAVLPEEMAQHLDGDRARPWIRMRVFSWNSRRRRIVDVGPAAASFRLVKTPYPLDSPLPRRPQQPVPVGLPVRGRWCILQGPFGEYSHRNIWAYDLVRIDAGGHESSPPNSRDNADYLAWDQPVLSPLEGHVVRTRSDVADGPAREKLQPKAKANEVYIRTANHLGLNLVHLQKGAVAVKPGARVTPGTQVGRVGNSGASFAPHLHLAVWGGRYLRQTVPVALQNVRVGLNPVDDDPWARELPSWEPREGYFVETIRPQRGSPRTSSRGQVPPPMQ